MTTLDLPASWCTSGTCDALWGKGSTYLPIPMAALPPVGPLDGSFGWLAGDEPVGNAMEYLPSQRALAAHATAAKDLGLTLPEPFLRFMTNPKLAGRVPSCTACYYEIGERLVPVPGHDGPVRMLRFLMDQQACVMWYLLLEPGGGHRVVAAYPKRFDDGEDVYDDDGAEPVPEGAATCAASFEEFIKRFWLENVIWFASWKKQPLAPEAEAYAVAARAAVARGALRK